MRSRVVSDDVRQYGSRSEHEVRSTLLELTRDFVLAAGRVAGVQRIAMLGSLLTDKPRPKDTDVLVTVGDDVDLSRLARLARRLKGLTQSRLNSGADVFLADSKGVYLGRICSYRECHPRALCRARHCSAVPHLNDDFDVVRLQPDLLAAPPLELHPAIVARVTLPDDVRQILVASVAMVSHNDA
ncbi:MAG TPA: hypothetical protein VF042_03070 [Gemmatimonadaceae bacterium]